MLPHVVRWNTPSASVRYAELLDIAGRGRTSGAEATAGERLAGRLEDLARAGGLPRTLRELGATRDHLSDLAADAASQWTGTFNPRPFDAAAALSLYEDAY
jgi:alcohol dehydrogenase class IV